MIDDNVILVEELFFESEEPSTLAEVVDLDRPFLTTDFNDYTVTEGLLLLILVLAVVMICVKMLKGGFYWL